MQYADVQWKMTVENTSVQIDRGILRTQHFTFAYGRASLPYGSESALISIHNPDHSCSNSGR